MAKIEEMTVKRLCDLSEVRVRLTPKQRATQDEVRTLAREILRLRIAIRGARYNAQRVMLECELAITDSNVAGGKDAV